MGLPGRSVTDGFRGKVASVVDSSRQDCPIVASIAIGVVGRYDGLFGPGVDVNIDRGAIVTDYPQLLILYRLLRSLPHYVDHRAEVDERFRGLFVGVEDYPGRYSYRGRDRETRFGLHQAWSDQVNAETTNMMDAPQKPHAVAAI